MNTESSSVTESLQQLVRHAEFNSRSMKWINILLVFLLCVVGGGVGYTQMTLKSLSKKTSFSWYDVDASRSRGDLQKALKQANELLTKNPRDFDGLYQKGEILLMLNDREGALKSFQEASDIFPIYKYKSAVDALKKS